MLGDKERREEKEYQRARTLEAEETDVPRTRVEVLGAKSNIESEDEEEKEAEK